jgi:hypothetical protein
MAMTNAFTLSGLNGGIAATGTKHARVRRCRLVSSRALPPVQLLEQRQLFSVGPTPISVSAVNVIHETVNVPFAADLGSFTFLAPGTNLSASVSWGDGTTSTGVVKADGVVGIDEIKFEVDGSHTYAKTGSFPVIATVFKTGVTPTSPDIIVTTLHDAAIVTAKSTNTPLDGNIGGTYSVTPPTSTAAGSEYHFNGTGTAGVLGPVSASGDVNYSGSINTASTATGLATGTLTLTSAATTSAAGGSVTLRLTGAPSTRAGAFPSSFTYVITGGTGIYADATGSGTIAVMLGNSSSADSFEFVIKSSVVPPPLMPIMSLNDLQPEVSDV